MGTNKHIQSFRHSPTAYTELVTDTADRTGCQLFDACSNAPGLLDWEQTDAHSRPNPVYSTVMASHDPLTESQTTFPSDSENYDADHSNPNSSDEPPSSSSSPLIVYQPPTLWSIVRGAAINLLLPFVNGLMLGFGELFAHEAAFRLGWSKTKVFPSYRNSRPVGPGVGIRQDPVERRRRDGEEMDAYTSLE